MFTGIVELSSPTYSLEYKKDLLILTISVPLNFLKDVKIGHSIAVNGTCLTVTSKTDNLFTVEVSKHTLSLTNIGYLKVGDFVNLEKSLKYQGDFNEVERYGGHFVQGHVDCSVMVFNYWVDDSGAKWYEFGFVSDKDEVNKKYIVGKGYVALDGVSLTVAKTFMKEGKFRFCVMMVPHTQSIVINSNREVGERVNLEVDIIGKYVEKMYNDGKLPAYSFKGETSAVGQ